MRFAFARLEERVKREQIVGMKTTLGFQLQKAGAVGFRQVRHRGLNGEHPVQRQAQRAIPFADAQAVQVISDFAPH